MKPHFVCLPLIGLVLGACAPIDAADPGAADPSAAEQELVLATQATIASSGSIEGEALVLTRAQGSVVADAAASGARALRVWSNDTATGALLGGGNTLRVVARAELCNGAPSLTVSVDGVAVGTIAVTTTTYRAYDLALDLSNARHAVAVAFTNDAYLPGTCDRNVVLDWVSAGYVRPSGPNTVRYEDLVAPGEGLREVMARVPAGKQLTLPAGVFEFSDFSFGGGTRGLSVKPDTLGLAGSGIDRTIVRMRARSSSRAALVPPQSRAPATNQLELLEMFDGNGQTLEGFTLEGTDQGHLYNGIQIHSANATVHDLKVTGIPGDANTPPGETFGISVWAADGMVGRRIEVSGIRTADGVNVGAAPFGFNSASNARLTDCYFHDNWTSTFALWQSHDVTTYNTRSVNNGSGTGIHAAHGINHERCYNITHWNPTVKINHDAPVSNASYHMSMNNDLRDGLLTVHNPSWDHDSRLAGDRFIIMSFASYRGVPQRIVTKPVVRDAVGNLLAAFAWAH